MAKILVVYFSQTGNTRKMAEAVKEGVEKEGIEVNLKELKDIKADDLLKYEGLIIGSPTYYGTMAAEIKQLLDDSVKFHGKLDGKVGAAFSSSANIGGGNETTVLDILQALLIHGMIIQGDPHGDHYGPVAVGTPDGRSIRQCQRLGSRVARLVKKIYG
ncbi:MAG: NAD(P)H-dependent oxidoreductase [Candidatus Omnitrophica bacterium]|nr:NAD(P)H-dependent oxidoreductase [Candidatus Omnitrophota bacterium]